MHIILGGNGHIGSVLAQALLAQDEPVTIVSRTSASGSKWDKLGAQVAVADVYDTARLKDVFSSGTRLFLLNPPADPATDTDVEERRSVSSILQAVSESNFEKIVAISSYGVQKGDHIGDLGVLYDMEQRLSKQSAPVSIIRAAYYMSNWDFSLPTAQQDGVIYTFFPANFTLPMVAPQDIGHFAARLMTEPAQDGKTYNIEGPERYSASDVAEAFSQALHKPVEAVEIPQQQWATSMQEIGFSCEAAESFSNMTAKTMEAMFPEQDTVVHTPTSLSTYIAHLTQAKRSAEE